MSQAKKVTFVGNVIIKEKTKKKKRKYRKILKEIVDSFNNKEPEMKELGDIGKW